MTTLRLALPALALGFAALLPQAVHAQQNWPPAPAEYPAVKLPAGLTSNPIINSPAKAAFRTRLREGSSQGSNFGGHYALLTWGCGDGCTTFFILDELNGRVYEPGFHVTTPKGSAVAGSPLHFQPDSRLLVMEGCRSNLPGACGKYYMLWTGSGLETLLHEPVTGAPGSVGGN